jgi:hypothetical protein
MKVQLIAIHFNRSYGISTMSSKQLYMHRLERLLNKLQHTTYRNRHRSFHSNRNASTKVFPGVVTPGSLRKQSLLLRGKEIQSKFPFYSL